MTANYTPSVPGDVGITIGTDSNNVVSLDSEAKLPAVDGSQLTNLPSGATAFVDLSDVPASYSGQGGKIVAVNSGGTALEFITAPSSSSDGSIGFTLDGGGSTLTTGIAGDIVIPYACTITSATLVADQTGSIVIDVWKDTYANYPPTDADSITASAPPTLSSAAKSQDTTLTGWTTTLSAGDILRFNVDSVSTVTRVTLSLAVTKG